MLPSGTSGYRIDEMVRRSDARRRDGGYERERRGTRRQGMKRMASVIAAAALWPLRH